MLITICFFAEHQSDMKTLHRMVLDWLRVPTGIRMNDLSFRYISYLSSNDLVLH